MSELRRKPEVDYYKVLQVDSEAEPEVVEAAYRALSKKYHPDVNPLPEAQERMSQINTAYGILGDVSKRHDYNLLRGNVSHYIKSPAQPSATSSTSSNTYRPSTAYTRPPTPPTNGATSSSGYQASSTSGSTANRSTKASPTNGPSSTAKRPPNPYQTSRPSTPPPAPSARSEAQSRAKGGINRASHYIYDTKKKLPLGRLVIIFCVAVVLLVVMVLVQESFLGNPIGTHFITHAASNNPPASFEPLQVVTPVPTVLPTQSNFDALSRDNVVTFLQNSTLFAGRVGAGDVSLSGDTIQLKVKLSDKGAGSNAAITASAGQAMPAALQSDPLANFRAAETTAYSVIYPLFRQFSPQLSHIVLGVTNLAGDNVVYKMDVTRDAAFGFYSWQSVNSSVPVSELNRLAISDRLAAHFGAPQDDKSHALLLAPDEATLNAEIASWGIEGTTINFQPSGQVLISYLLNHSPVETQLDLVKIIYALYTRFPNFDRLQLTTAVAGQGGATVWCNRELFDKIGVSTWAQKVYTGDVTELFSSLPKTEALLRQQTSAAAPTPQPVNTSLRVRTWQVEVIKTEQINGIPGYTPNGSNQLWAVTIELHNGSSQVIYPLLDEIFSLSDSQRRLFQPDIAASVQYNLSNNYPNLAPLSAGQQTRLTLIFSIPRGSNNQKLSLQVRDNDIKGQVYLQ